MKAETFPMDAVAALLREMRRRRGWSQRTLAAQARVHRNTVIQMELRPARLSVATLLRVAQAMEVDAWRVLRRAERRGFPAVPPSG